MWRDVWYIIRTGIYYGISQVQIGNQNINDRRLRNPTPLILDRFGGTPI